MMMARPRSRRTSRIVFFRRMSRRAALYAVLLASSMLAGRCGHGPPSHQVSAALLSAPLTIVGHPLRVDADHKLLSWSRSASPYATVAGLAWHALETKFPVQDNGLPTYLAWSRFDPVTFEGV